MRFLVFLLGFLGALTTGAMGLLWLGSTVDPSLVTDAHDAVLQIGFLPVDVIPNPGDPMTLKAGAFLLAGFLLALVGSLLVLLRRGLLGAVLMLLAVMGPALLHHATLTGTCLLVPAALLSLFVRRPTPDDGALTDGRLAVE
jgi:hypothetical protein